MVQRKMNSHVTRELIERKLSNPGGGEKKTGFIGETFATLRAREKQRKRRSAGKNRLTGHIPNRSCGGKLAQKTKLGSGNEILSWSKGKIPAQKGEKSLR